MFTKLRNRLTLIFIILTLVPMILIAVVLGRNIYDESVEEAQTIQQLIEDEVAIAVTDEIEKHVNELIILGEAVQLNELSPAEQQGVLGSVLTVNQAYNNIAVITPDGQTQSEVALFDIVSTDNLANYSQDPLFMQTVETGIVNYSEVFFDDLTGEPLLTLAVPLYDDRSNELAYVIFANFRFRLIWNLVARIERQSSREIELFLTDPSGTVIAHANPTYVFQKAVYEAPEGSGFGTGLGGVESLISSKPLTINNLQFTIVGQEALGTALAEARSAVINAAIIVALATLAAIVVIFFVARQIVQPIEQLAGVADEIRDGNLNATAAVNRRDEIGKMANAFNGMTAELRRTLSGLEENVQELEASNEERAQLIADLQKARRIAEENSRLKSEFLAMMSHELRTPMNAIEGFTSIMLNHLGGVEFNEEAEDFLQRIQGNSKRLLALINDFLDLSRIESGRLELSSGSISPKTLATNWQNEIGILADRKELEFEVNIDSNVPETVMGDAEALSKVAINLLSNAIKFTEAGKVSLSLKCNEDKWQVIVTDTGIGIPPHAREYIFDEFRQVDQSSKRKYGGTGLGLAISQKLVRAMGGNIALESEMGRGSTFTVTLPTNGKQGLEE